MSFEVPKEKKIYTTSYEGFKGVDYTNDATNIYKRRTPTGTNMISSLDGKPRKRTGWEVAISEEDFNEIAKTYGRAVEKASNEFEIYKCDYFELAGCDHIVMFTTLGLFAYRTIANNEEAEAELVILSNDSSMCLNYDRAFFFDADGETAYYIYGEYKVWKYHYDENAYVFKFEEAVPTVPTVRIAVSADGSSGTMHESSNMLTNKVAEEFQNNTIPYVSTATSDAGAVTVDEKLFLVSYGTAKAHTFKYDGDWTDEDGATVTLSLIGIDLAGEPTDGSEITVTVDYHHVTYLAYNVIIEDYNEVIIKASDSVEDGQFGTDIEVISGGVPTATQARLENATEDGVLKTRLVYGSIHTPLIDGADAIRVEYPAVRENVTHHETGEIEVDVTVFGGGD